MVSYPVQNYKAKVSLFREFWTKKVWPSTRKAISMLFRNTKIQKRFEKVVTTIILVSLFSTMHAPQVQAIGEYSVPDDWPAEWVAPFADEIEVSQVQPPKYPTIEDKEPRFIKFVAATAYSSDVHQTDAQPFRPAMAMDFRDEVAKKGGVYCIAHNDLRLGTKVRFPELFGDMVYTVCDRMNTRYSGQNRVDFYFYVIGTDGKIDSKDSLTLARTNAKSFGLKRKVKMEVF